ncbi:recombinase family protein [Candidatus Woesebacteria bacterium]|nr:recombinase family protein [Candidatus Woesebacteria bacterium]
MQTCVQYVRVSSEDQISGFSLDAQLDACKKLAKTNNLKIIGTYRDEGQSAREKDRPEFQKMIARCEAEHIDYVLVYHTDRFARNSLDHAIVKDKLRKANTTLLSYSQPMIDSSPEGKFLDGVLASVNQFYSDDLSRKTKMGMRRKWDEGWWPSWAPIGYNNVKKDNGVKGYVEIDPIQGPLVLEAFKKYATGNYSLIKLSELMYQKGLKSRKKNQVLTDSSLQQMISNTFYYGLMHWSGETKIGNHKPLIDRSLFDQCQYIASQHRQFLLRVRKHRFLLRGFAYCPVHERRLTAEWHFGLNSKARDRVGYYHCCNTGGCKTSYIQSDKLENMVAKLVDRYQFSEEFINLVKEQMKSRILEAKGTINSQKQELVNKRSGIEQKRNSLEDSLVDGTIDRDAYKRQHERLENDIIQLDNQIANLEGQRNLDMKLVDEVLGLTRNISQTYRDAPFELKRQYLRLFFEKIYVEDKKVGKLHETPIFSTLRKQQQVIIKKNWLPR